ncbi:hypothetical protein C8R47DRAFT_756061 [Mycena vitilis]|nr:hypothetical protein C8R47DRAFT_756061 [Mycena vitilis]
MGKTSSWETLLASIRIMCSHAEQPLPGSHYWKHQLPDACHWQHRRPYNLTVGVGTHLGHKNMSKAFPGSVVLTQDCPGHTSLAAPSTCTWGYLREYFYSGILPGKDTVCPVLGSLFPEQAFPGEEQAAFASTREQTVVSVIRRLSTAFQAAQPRAAATRLSF